MTVEGSVVGNGNLVVKGAVKGTLSGDSVVISEEGHIAADTHAQTMTVGGSFEGRVETAGQLGDSVNREMLGRDRVRRPGCGSRRPVGCQGELQGADQRQKVIARFDASEKRSFVIAVYCVRIAIVALADEIIEFRVGVRSHRQPGRSAFYSASCAFECTQVRRRWAIHETFFLYRYSLGVYRSHKR